ncbi:unnamed protein product, partial [Brugia timori]|uniref:Reverse transcriptase domain-containing protein n=1 Tax=Brugia timori TaxID=42155 RepID=A0A0R3Q4V0_9BILA
HSPADDSQPTGGEHTPQDQHLQDLLGSLQEVDIGDISDQCLLPQRQKRSTPGANYILSDDDSDGSSTPTLPSKAPPPFSGLKPEFPYTDPETGRVVIKHSKRGNKYFADETPAQMHARVTSERTLQSSASRAVNLKTKLATKKQQKREAAIQAQKEARSKLQTTHREARTAKASPLMPATLSTSVPATLGTTTLPPTPTLAAPSAILVPPCLPINATQPQAADEALRLAAENKALKSEIATLQVVIQDLQQDTSATRLARLEEENRSLQATVLELQAKMSNLSSDLPARSVPSTSTAATIPSADHLDTLIAKQIGTALEARLEPIIERLMRSLLGTSTIEKTPPTNQPVPAALNRPQQKKKKNKSTNRPAAPSSVMDISPPRSSEEVTPLGNSSSSAPSPSAGVTQPSYASAARKPPRQTQPPAPSKSRQDPPRSRPSPMKKLNPPTFQTTAVLVAPTTAGQKALDVVKLTPGINPIDLGIKSHVEFPSGSVLLRCSSQENATQLRSLLAPVSSIQVRDKREVEPEVRIHNVPGDTSETQLENILLQRLHEPVQVRYVEYAAPALPGTKLAIVCLSLEAYNNCRGKRVRIGWASCKLQTIPYIPRCPRCHLLGHKEKSCPSPAPMEADSDSAQPPVTASGAPEQPPLPGQCADCVHYNETVQKAGLPRHRRRLTDHATNSQKCPSRLALIRRRLPTKAAVLATGPSEGLPPTTNHGEEVGASILGIAEPYLHGGRVPSTSWLQHIEGQAALLFRPHLAPHVTRLPCSIPDVACCRLQTLNILALYLPPGCDMTAVISDLTGFVLSLSGPVLLVGDFNATTSLILGQSTNHRGEALEEFILMTRLDLLNPDTPTWHRRNCSSRTLDYALCSGLPASCLVRTDLDSCSDHHFLQVSVQPPEAPPPVTANTHLDKTALECLVKDAIFLLPDSLDTVESVDSCVATLTSQLQAFLRSASRTHRPSPTSLHWWRPELGTFRTALNRLRRLLQTDPPPLARQILLLAQKFVRRHYRRAMFAAKLDAWKEFISKDKAWGKPYRVLCKARTRTTFPPLRRADGSLCSSAEEAYGLLLADKFSSEPSLHEGMSYNFPLAQGPAPRVTPQWLGQVIRKLDNRKAPGPDGIPNSLIKLVNKHHPKILPVIFTSCLTLGYFPQQWKRGTVVFIPKPGKNPALPDGHRPITLLCGFGKLLEVVLNVALVDHLESANLLHAEQFGFRRHRGTEDAVHDALEKIRSTRATSWYTAALSFDIRGAFDNASWAAILQAPELADVPAYIRLCLRSYFSGRVVECHGSTRQLQRGCPQGSVLGPTLWNLVHNATIARLVTAYPGVTCYADDTLVVLGANNKVSLQAECTLCISRMTSHVALNGLQLNHTKTEILVFVDAPRWEQIHQPDEHGWPCVRFHGRDILTCRQIRYLGVILDNEERWDEHIKHALSRCANALLPLLRLCQRTF